MIVPGNLFVIAAPSGTGKTTLVKKLVESIPNITVSISHTTRPKRPNEIDNVNYHFIDTETFKKMTAHGDFLEHAVVFNNLYGTSRSWVEQTLARGIDVILEIDWQGCQQIQKLFPSCIAIYVLPPSLKDLAERLVSRNQDKPEIIQLRLADVKKTLNHIHEYDFMVVNDNFENAVSELKTIVLAERLSQQQQVLRLTKLLDELTSTT